MPARCFLASGFRIGAGWEFSTGEIFWKRILFLRKQKFSMRGKKLFLPKKNFKSLVCKEDRNIVFNFIFNWLGLTKLHNVPEDPHKFWVLSDGDSPAREPSLRQSEGCDYNFQMALCDCLISDSHGCSVTGACCAGWEFNNPPWLESGVEGCTSAMQGSPPARHRPRHKFSGVGGGTSQ